MGALVGEEHWEDWEGIGERVGKESSLPYAPVLSLSNVPWGEGSIGKGLEHQLLYFYLSFHPMIFGIVSFNSLCLHSSYSFLVLIPVQESNVASDSKTTLSSMNCEETHKY